MTVHTMRAAIMFDCCHRISARAAVVALCLNPVSMVIKLGSDGVCSGVGAARLEERSYRCYCRCCFTRLLNKLAGKIRGDSAQPPQVPAASFSQLMSINMARYSNAMNGILSDSECRVAVLFWPIVNVATLPWYLRSQWRLKECFLV